MNTIYSWKFEDKKNRWASWYTIALSIVVWLAIWGFLTKQYWMSFIVLLVAWVFYFLENNSEDEVSVFLTDLWIQIGQSFYDYSKIENYTYIYDNSTPIYLRLSINRTGIKNIDLKISEKIVLDLKNILPNYIEENPKWELSFVEKMIERLKL